MHGSVTQKANPANSAGVSAGLPNGPGAAAILAAGMGSFAVGLFAVVADKSAAIKSLMIFSKPTGPLSGVTTSAIVVWLITWAVLHARWRGKTVALRPVKIAALLLLALGLLLTFPPFADLL
ncbi:MAG TPA: hypothetical protein VGF96_18780 [Terracidiphilus sp.]|jgi:hypothetical protein